MNQKRKTFLINSLALTISSILFRVLGVFFNSYITQKIGKEMLGIFNLVMSVYAFGITLASFGIQFSVTRLVSEELAIGNQEAVKKITKKAIIISFLCGAGASSILLFFSDFILGNCLHHKVNKNVIYVMCLALPFISMSSAISGYFVAIRRVYKSTIAQFFEQVIKIGITAYCLYQFLPNGLGYACFALILGDFISEVFSFFANYFLYWHDSKRYKTSYITHYSKKYYTQKILRIATPIAITSLIRSGLSTLKQIIIPLSFEKGKMDCQKALSIYAEINGMAMPIVVFPNVIFSSISGLLIPEFATYHAQQKQQQIRKMTYLILIISTFIASFVSIFLFVFADSLSDWIYKDTSIARYIRLLSPIAIFILLDCVIDNILKGLDSQNDVMLINILDLFLTILFIYFLVPRFGIKGYLVSMYFSEIFNLSLSMRKLIQVVQNKQPSI